MFRIINTKKEMQWLDLKWLRERNVDGRGGLRIIDVAAYIEKAQPKIKEVYDAVQPSYEAYLRGVRDD